MTLIVIVGVVLLMGAMVIKIFERFRRNKYSTDFLLAAGMYVVFVLFLTSCDILFGSLASFSGNWLLSSMFFVYITIIVKGDPPPYSDQQNLVFALVFYFITGTIIYFFIKKGKRWADNQSIVNATSTVDFNLLSISVEGFRVLYWWHISTALISTYFFYTLSFGLSPEFSVWRVPLIFVILLFWINWTVLYYFKFSDRMKERDYADLLSDSEKYQNVQSLIQTIDEQGACIITGKDVTENLIYCIHKEIFHTIGVETIQKIKLTDEIKLFFSQSFKTYYEKQKTTE